MTTLTIKKSFWDSFFKANFKAMGYLAIFILIGIFIMLVSNGILAFRDASLLEFFTTIKWTPSAYISPKFGILAMIASSVMVTVIAMLIAVPIGVLAAAYLAEFAPKRVTSIVKPAIEMLAAIPSVTIGFLGIVFFGPMIANFFGISNGLNALNAGILLAIMALPTIISISEDAIYAVPQSYKEASYALGANKWETLIRVILPAGSSGIIAAIMLAMGRVIGETMAVLMASGNAIAMPKSIFSAVQPITSTIAIEMGEVPYDTPHYYSLFALGVVLFIITLFINLSTDAITKKMNKNG